MKNGGDECDETLALVWAPLRDSYYHHQPSWRINNSHTEHPNSEAEVTGRAVTACGSRMESNDSELFRV